MTHSGDRIAIVAGGAGGIGEAIVRRLAEDDYVPIILDQDKQAGQAALAHLVSDGGRGEFIGLDLTQSTEVQGAFSKINAAHGRLDVLVNVAGGSLYKHPLEDFPLLEWKKVIDVNLKATFLCCQAFVQIMQSHNTGIIINTSSNFVVTGSATRSAYAASKAAVIAFTKSLALELGPHGIRANVVAPGLTATEKVMGHFSPELWAQQGKSVPMGRTAEVRDIGEAVAFLSSEASGYMTGQTLHVNGGLVMP